MADAAIDIDRLTVRYRGKPAVNQLTLAIPAGSVFALLGDNGAGKSTTMKVLTGLVRPDAGRAEILGYSCWSRAYELRHRVGYVPERPKFYDWMTVRDTGWFTSSFHRRGFLEQYEAWVEKLDLDPTKKLRDLSKGGYARVGLALALAADPQVLLLDEPTSGLDLLTRREFLSSLVELAAEGRTILISSHSISELERFASHAAFVKDGKVFLTASLDDLRAKFRRVEYRLAAGERPDTSNVGTILQRTKVGKFTSLLIQDPDADGLAVLSGAAGVTDFEEGAVNLEDVYAALMAREGGRKRAPVKERTADEYEDELQDEGV